jgi:cell division protein FtsB
MVHGGYPIRCEPCLFYGESLICPLFMKKIIPIIANKYFLAITFFVVWMLFFDERNYFDQRDERQKLEKLEAKKKYYETEIEKARKELQDLQNNPAALEKYARERYLMKKQGEDIYIIEDSTQKQ